MGWDSILSNMPYGERARKHRKWIHEAIQEKQSLAAYYPVQCRELEILMDGLTKSPENFVAHFQQYELSIDIHALR